MTHKVVWATPPVVLYALAYPTTQPLPQTIATTTWDRGVPCAPRFHCPTIKRVKVTPFNANGFMEMWRHPMPCLCLFYFLVRLYLPLVIPFGRDKYQLFFKLCTTVLPADKNQPWPTLNCGNRWVFQSFMGCLT